MKIKNDKRKGKKSITTFFGFFFSSYFRKTFPSRFPCLHSLTGRGEIPRGTQTPELSNRDNAINVTYD
jgi:hypothetical protein